ALFSQLVRHQHAMRQCRVPFGTAGRMANGEWRIAEVRGPRSESKGQGAKFRGPRSEGKGQRTAVRRQRVEAKDHGPGTSGEEGRDQRADGPELFALAIRHLSFGVCD